MPLYEYECKKCHHRFEEIQLYSDPPIRKCPKCKVGRVRKLPSAPAVQFKGSGWYVTDYGRKGSSSTLPDRGDSSKEKAESDKKGAETQSVGKDSTAGKDSSVGKAGTGRKEGSGAKESGRKGGR